MDDTKTLLGARVAILKDAAETLTNLWPLMTGAPVHKKQITEMAGTISKLLERVLKGEALACPLCKKGWLLVKSSNTGGHFVGCSNFPDCKHSQSWDSAVTLLFQPK